MSAISLSQLIATYFTSPASLVSFAVQFLLGLGAGYFLAKGLKYILAFFVVLVVGDLLNVWAIHGVNLTRLTASLANASAVEAQLSNIMPLAQLVYPLLSTSAVVVGFVVGAAIALLK